MIIHDKMDMIKRLRSEIRDLSISIEKAVAEIGTLKHQLETNLVDLELKEDISSKKIEDIISDYHGKIELLNKEVATNEVLLQAKNRTVSDLELSVNNELHQRKTNIIKARIAEARSKLDKTSKEYERAKNQLMETHKALKELSGLEPSGLDNQYLLSSAHFFYQPLDFNAIDKKLDNWETIINSIYDKQGRAVVTKWNISEYIDMGVE